MLRGTLFFLSWMLTWGLSAQVDIQKEALANYKSSLFKDAIPLYEQIVKSGHFTKENLYQLASCYYYTDQTKKAQRLLYQLLNYVSDDSSLMLLVQVLMMNGEYNKAIPIIKQLIEKIDEPIVLFKGPDEDVSEFLIRDNIYVFEGSLKQAMEGIRQCKTFISNDTGPMHIFATQGCRTLVLYSGASDPALCAQRGETVTILRREHLQDLSATDVAMALSTVDSGASS